MQKGPKNNEDIGADRVLRQYNKKISSDWKQSFWYPPTKQNFNDRK